MSTLYVPRSAHMDSRYGNMVTSDMYDIHERVREVDPSLFIVYDPERVKGRYTIMERCPDNVDRKVFSVQELDGRVIQRLKEIMSVDPMTRAEELMREVDRNNAKVDEDRMDLMADTIGDPMRRALLRADGSVGPMSYPKRNRAAMRARARGK